MSEFLVIDDPLDSFIEARPNPADDLANFLEDHRRKIAEAFSASESNQREHD